MATSKTKHSECCQNTPADRCRRSGFFYCAWSWAEGLGETFAILSAKFSALSLFILLLASLQQIFQRQNDQQPLQCNFLKTKNMKNKTTLYHFVIDQSGSMAGAEQATIAGFNTQLKTIQELKTEHPDEKYLCSLTLFNAQINDVIRYADVEKLKALNIETYQPNGATALLDAIGKSIFSIKERFAIDIAEDKMSVVLVIITDGHENCSRMYTYHDIAQLIKTLDNTGKWTFSFLGADFDAIHTSHMLNIRKENVMNFSKSNYAGMMDDVSSSIRNYAESKSSGNMKHDLFDIFEKKDRRDNENNK
jgi:uncharacterized protein YegL